MKVLVVEDHAANRRVVQLLLEPFCSNIRFAENGLEAVEACRQESFDVVLMDMQMPVMDGLAAITEIRARERSQGAARTPIAVLSANVGADHETAGALAGADAHIAKPVTLEALIEGINLAMVRAEA
jgi:CheY-like chemotaxis protein